MYTNYFKHVPQEQIQRTKILLYNVRHKYDIDTYVFTKKMLLVSLIIHFYQKETRKGPWISYSSILERYERKYQKCDNKIEYKDFGQSYFGINKTMILTSTLTQIENIVIERCIHEIGTINKD